LKDWHHGADLAVEATGVPAVASGMTSYMANGGKGLFFGVCPSDAKIEVSPFEIFRRQLTLAGSHSLNHNIPGSSKVIEGLGSDIDRAVSHRMSLYDISDVLASKPPQNSLKVQWIAD
jgi:threonine dehydrogenase-like Zn-dependent dehydrogenase